MSTERDEQFLAGVKFLERALDAEEKLLNAERRGAVLALRKLAAEHHRWEFARIITARADEIENGADL